MSLPRRVTAKIDFEADGGCWLWRASAQNAGYGQVMVRGRMWLVHRLVWTTLFGSIPEGQMIDHKCRVPRCCNPAHLRIVSPGENTTENTVNRRIVNGRRDRCMRDLHDLTGDNAGVRPNGLRYCKACVRERYREKQRALGRIVVPRK